MKLTMAYLGIIALIVLLIVMFGMVCPVLISAANTFTVVLGFLCFILTPVFAYWMGRKLYKVIKEN